MLNSSSRRSLQASRKVRNMRPDWMHADGGEALVEAMDDVQDDRVISDDLTQVTQSINHGLELVAVVSDGERSPYTKVLKAASR